MSCSCRPLIFFCGFYPAYKLPPLTVAVLSLLGLVAFMLLVCLLSCLYKVHRRNEKNKKLTVLAQQAGKGDGQAFRQVTHDNGRCVFVFWLGVRMGIWWPFCPAELDQDQAGSQIRACLPCWLGICCY